MPTDNDQVQRRYARRGSEKKTIAVVLPVDQINWLKSVARATGKSVSLVTSSALDEVIHGRRMDVGEEKAS